jgi:hypothetical protein
MENIRVIIFIRWLDWVLEYFTDTIVEAGGMSHRLRYVSYNDAYKAIIELHRDELNNVAFELEFDLILEKLLKDGYIKFLRNELNPINGLQNYVATYEGRLFNFRGGYGAILQNEALKSQIQNQSRRRQIFRDWLLIIGSWVAAAGAVGLTTVELVKHYQHWK